MNNQKLSLDHISFNQHTHACLVYKTGFKDIKMTSIHLHDLFCSLVLLTRESIWQKENIEQQQQYHHQ